MGDQPRKTVTVSAPAAAGNGARAARPATGPAPRSPEGRSTGVTADRGTERRWVSVVSLRTQFVPPPGDVSGEGLEDLLDDAASVVGEQIARFGGTVTASLGSVSWPSSASAPPPPRTTSARRCRPLWPYVTPSVPAPPRPPGRAV
ncbi:hypothetical protein ACFQ3Z_43370 [Streptomyces nogalater]